MRWLVIAVLFIGLALGTPRVARGQAEASPTPFESVRIIIEFNSTGQDAGVQLFFDAEAWKTVSVLDPKGHKIFEVKPKGKLRALGGSELSVESDEPDIADVPLADLFAQFPEGTYTFVGTSPDGEEAEEHGDVLARDPGWPDHRLPARWTPLTRSSRGIPSRHPPGSTS